MDFARTIMSHGVADLPPAQIDEQARTLRTTVSLPSAQPRTIRIREGSRAVARVEIEGRKPSVRHARHIRQTVRQILNLDEDLSDFYTLVSTDPELSWAAAGAGRMVRTPTIYEAVIKTVCTTNVPWSATVRRVMALVENLGEQATGDTDHAFPTAEAMAAKPEAFYRKVVRAGYRSTYLRALAAGVADGTIELEDLAAASDVSDDEVAARLLALPGIGPYAAAHMMMLLGRHSRLILDSWTRPKYARLNGRKASDKTIERRFRRYRALRRARLLAISHARLGPRANENGVSLPQRREAERI